MADVKGHDIIVIGASMGGIETLSNLVAQFPEDLPAAIFIVVHIAPNGPGVLAQILDRTGPLTAKLAENGESIRHGRIYVAPPDHHLLVKQGFIRVTRGPRENRSRPAIDPLFRSAAVAYGSRVIGVILTGFQNDGTAGLITIKRCGGVAVVQEPKDALALDMPQSALDSVEVDHCLAVSGMGAVLDRLAREPVKETPPSAGRLF
jgi:Chemotaxis response regulator containing a CheY-like receiver domain and a methylesterase domain